MLIGAKKVWSLGLLGVVLVVGGCHRTPTVVNRGKEQVIGKDPDGTPHIKIVDCIASDKQTTTLEMVNRGQTTYCFVRWMETAKKRRMFENVVVGTQDPKEAEQRARAFAQPAPDPDNSLQFQCMAVAGPKSIGASFFWGWAKDTYSHNCHD